MDEPAAGKPDLAVVAGARSRRSGVGRGSLGRRGRLLRSLLLVGRGGHNDWGRIRGVSAELASCGLMDTAKRKRHCRKEEERLHGCILSME
jgi:hypothetical protein